VSADRIERQVAPGLEPDFRTDVVEHARAESGVDEQVMQFLHAFRLLARQFADRETVAFHVVDDAGFGDGGGRVDDAADDLVGVDVLAERTVGIERVEALAVMRAAVVVEIPPRNAVLHGDDHGVRTDDTVHLARHLFQVVRLQGQDDEVMRAQFGDVVCGLGDLGDVFGAVLPDQLEPVLLDRFQVRPLVDDADFVSGQRQLGAHEAANGPGADHTDFHGFLPAIDQCALWHETGSAAPVSHDHNTVSPRDKTEAGQN